MTNLGLLEAVLALHGADHGSETPEFPEYTSPEFLNFCQRHQIAAYAGALLEDHNLDRTLEPKTRKGFKLAQFDQWQRSERLLRELQTLSALFRESGVEFIVMKGPYVAQRYFGGIERRAFSDLDILVRTDSLPKSIELLTASGYTAVSPTGLPKWTRRYLHHLEFRNGNKQLDLHHTLRAHPTFRITEESLWARNSAFDFPGFSCRVLPDDLCLLVQILSIHADISLGTANLKMLVDLDRILHASHGWMDWPAFFSERERDGTLAISLNVLALLLTIFRNADRYPGLSPVLRARRDQLVWQPDRVRYLQLFDGTDLTTAKSWALRQFDQSLPMAVVSWLVSLPVMAVGLGESFLGNLRARLQQPGTVRSAGTAGQPMWNSRESLVNSLGGDADALRSCRIRIGSLSLQLSYTDDKYLAMLAELFRLQAAPAENEDTSWADDDHLLIFDAAEERLRAAVPRPAHPVIDRSLEGIIEIHRDAACCIVSRAGQGIKLAIPVVSAGAEYEHLLHCVMVVLYRALFALERLPLHAAAVQSGNTADLFIGDKGAGKSTISLKLGLAGARVLGEDHVLLRRTGDGFVVSGCDGKSRLTAKSERHFFSEPLPVEAVDVAGIPKKEIDLADHVCSAPFEDVPVGRIFFPHVGEKLQLRPMQGAEALVKLLGMTRERLRFTGAADRKGFLDFFGDFLGSAGTWDLTLSPDLDDLDDLVTILQQGGESPDPNGTNAGRSAAAAPPSADPPPPS